MSGEVFMQEAFRLSDGAGPHAGQPVYAAGAPLAGSRAAFVLAHGRGASAEDILSIARELNLPGTTYLAPEAAANAWYPQRFMAPLPANEPWLSGALAAIDAVVAQVRSAGIPMSSTYLMGFSQGACLVLEYAARNPAAFGGVIGLSGGLIGPDGDREPATAGRAPALRGVPVFLGCSDVDPHIPLYRVEQAAAWFTASGAEVTARIYPGMGHTVNRDELRFVQGLAQRGQAEPPPAK
jgi:predicted esterase